MARTIRFHLGREPLPKLRFVLSPLSEASFALEALVNPKRHPEHLRWVLDVRPRLVRSLWREIRYHAFAYRKWQAGFFFPTGEEAAPTFEQELHRLRSMPLELFRAELGRALLPKEGHRPEPELARALECEPEALHLRLVAMLEGFWNQLFAEEWERLLPLLQEDIARRQARLGAVELPRFLRELLPDLRLSPDLQTLQFTRPHEATVDMDQQSVLVMTPSAFTWARTRVNCDPPWTPGLVYPVGGNDVAVGSLPPRALAGVLAALAHEGRLQMLKLCAEAPRSTQELAQLLHLTEAAVSRHLHQLQAAGLVKPRRVSYYVLYATEPRRLRALSPSLLHYTQLR